jgi:hypothetical protein
MMDEASLVARDAPQITREDSNKGLFAELKDNNGGMNQNQDNNFVTYNPLGGDGGSGIVSPRSHGGMDEYNAFG